MVESLFLLSVRNSQNLDVIDAVVTGEKDTEVQRDEGKRNEKTKEKGEQL